MSLALAIRGLTLPAVPPRLPPDRLAVAAARVRAVPDPAAKSPRSPRLFPAVVFKAPVFRAWAIRSMLSLSPARGALSGQAKLWGPAKGPSAMFSVSEAATRVWALFRTKLICSCRVSATRSALWVPAGMMPMAPFSRSRTPASAERLLPVTSVRTGRSGVGMGLLPMIPTVARP